MVLPGEAEKHVFSIKNHNELLNIKKRLQKSQQLRTNTVSKNASQHKLIAI